MSKNKTVHKTKDNIYKKIFTEPELFVEFLENFIPIDILKNLSPERIEDVSERFLPLFSDNKDSDTVKRINLNDGEDLFVINILEHESEVNYTSSFKMLQYITYVLSDYVKENDKKYKEEIEKHGSTKRKLSASKDFKLPPVLPIVFYDGVTKWTSSMNLLERIYMGDIFEKYIPKFEYELVDLNQYSREDIIKYGNALSLILLIDKIRWADDMELYQTIPQDYLRKLEQNIPEKLLPLISDCVRVFLKHIEAPPEEIDRISESIHKRRLNEMFQMVDGYSVKKTRELAKKEAREELTKEVREEVKKEVAMEVTKEISKELTEKHNKEKIEMVKEMLADGEPVKKIIKYTKLTEQEIKDIEKTLL